MSEKRKLISLCSLLLFLVVILAVMIGISSHSADPTSTRYIQREKDEIRAYYSSLYFDTTGEGMGIVLENGIGYASFELKNYIDKDVTKRDIEYRIETVNQFYNKSGEKLDTLDGNQDLYVLDLWNTPTKIENDTYKYEVSLDTDSGETTTEGNYLFKYEERGTNAVGKTHKVTLKVERNDATTPMDTIEKISIVVEIIKPYKTIYIINMYVTNRLILFSDMDVEIMETHFKSLQIQTADSFSYYDSNSIKQEQTANAFQVTLTWEGLILNENNLKTIHNNVLDVLETTGTEGFLDISKPYIVEIQQFTADSGKDSGKLVIYIPPSADFSLNFLPTSDSFKVQATVSIYDECSNQYVLYTQNQFAGYVFGDDNTMDVINSENN